MVAYGVGVSHEVEPEDGEAFAEVRGVKQIVNEAAVCFFGRTPGKGIDDGGFRRETNEVKVEPADECAWIGLRCRLNASFLDTR